MPLDRVPPPRKRDAARSTAEILRAASDEFSEHGFAGARVERIAAASATNKALLFQRFGDKQGLYRAVLDQVRSAAIASRTAFAERLASEGTPRSAAEFHTCVAALVAVNLDFLDRHPAARGILFWEQASGWTVFRELGLPAADKSGESLLALFDWAATQGWIRAFPSPARQLAMTFEIAHNHGAALSRAGASLGTAERVFLAEFVADGLVTASKGRQP